MKDTSRQNRTPLSGLEWSSDMILTDGVMDRR